MTVIADSSVVNYLILIDTIQILQPLFGEVLIPKAVSEELRRPGTPSKVATWMSRRPDWLRLQTPKRITVDNALEKLGDGEREAVILALEYFPDVLLLIDEIKGREEAERRHIRFMGTLGILDKAAASGLLDLPSTLDRLLQTTFYVTPSLLKGLLEDDARRKKKL